MLTLILVVAVTTNLDPAAGGSDDYAMSHGVSYSFTLELRDEGKYGFDLPERFIIPTGDETYAGFRAVVRELVKRGQY